MVRTTEQIKTVGELVDWLSHLPRETVVSSWCPDTEQVERGVATMYDPGPGVCEITASMEAFDESEQEQEN